MNLFGETTEEPRGRAPDVLWDSLLAACGVDSAHVTRSARGAYNRAAGDLRMMKVTPEDIVGHAAVFRLRWPEVSMTPTALVRRWAETMPKKKTPAMAAKIERRPACGDCLSGWVELADGTVRRCKVCG